MLLGSRSRWLGVHLLVAVLTVPQLSEAAVDRIITFASTADGRPLNHGDLVDGTEWLSLGVRFVGQEMRIVNDSTCQFCLMGENVAAAFVQGGNLVVTSEVFIDYVGSSTAFTTVADVGGNILFQGAGDIAPQ